jgi:hypothetical protein
LEIKEGGEYGIYGGATEELVLSLDVRREVRNGL